MNGARKTWLGFAVVVLSVIATAAIGFASQNGKHQSVAINDRGTFVEVHIAGDTGTNNLWFNLGTISGEGESSGRLCLVQNDQVPAQAWNMTDSDFQTPWTSVALSGLNVVILFPGSSGNNDIWCVTGTIETTQPWNFVPKSITWNTAHRLTGAKNGLPEHLWGPVLVDYHYIEGAENPSFTLRYLDFDLVDLPSNCCCPSLGKICCGQKMTNTRYTSQQWRLSDLKGDTGRATVSTGFDLGNVFETIDLWGTNGCSDTYNKWGVKGPWGGWVHGGSVGYAGSWGDVIYYLKNWGGCEGGFSYFTTDSDGANNSFYYTDRGGPNPVMTTPGGSSFISRLAATDHSGNYYIGVFPIYEESDWEKIADYFKKSSEVMSGNAQKVCSAIGDIFASIDYWTGDSYKIYSITSNVGVKTYTNYLGGGERPTCAVNRDGIVMEVHMDAKAGSIELWFHFGFIDSVSTTWSGSYSFPKGPFLYDQDNWYCVDLN